MFWMTRIGNWALGPSTAATTVPSDSSFELAPCESTGFGFGADAASDDTLARGLRTESSTMRSPVPVFEMERGWVEICPVRRLAASVSGDALTLGGATPLPERTPKSSSPPGKSLETCKVPVKGPIPPGVNVIGTARRSAGARLKGSPLTAKAGLSDVTPNTCRTLVPRLEITSESVRDAPATTDPKSKSRLGTSITGVPLMSTCAGTETSGSVGSLLAMRIAPSYAPSRSPREFKATARSTLPPGGTVPAFGVTATHRIPGIVAWPESGNQSVGPEPSPTTPETSTLPSSSSRFARGMENRIDWGPRVTGRDRTRVRVRASYNDTVLEPSVNMWTSNSAPTSWPALAKDAGTPVSRFWSTSRERNPPKFSRSIEARKYSSTLRFVWSLEALSSVRSTNPPSPDGSVITTGSGAVEADANAGAETGAPGAACVSAAGPFMSSDLSRA